MRSSSSAASAATSPTAGWTPSPRRSSPASTCSGERTRPAPSWPGRPARRRQPAAASAGAARSSAATSAARAARRVASSPTRAAPPERAAAARRSTTQPVGSGPVRGGRRSLSSRVAWQSWAMSRSTSSGVAPGTAASRSAASSAWPIGRLAAASARRTAPVARTETLSAAAPGVPVGARSDRWMRPPRSKAAVLATRRRWRRTSGSASSRSTSPSSHSMSSRVRVRGGPPSARSVRPAQRATPTPANSPNGVGRLDIRIRYRSSLPSSRADPFSPGLARSSAASSDGLATAIACRTNGASGRLGASRSARAR